MDMNEYQRLAQRTSNTKHRSLDEAVINGAMGLCGESGEIMDIIKKWKYQGHMLIAADVIDECGDVLWYLAEIASGLETSLSEIAEKNIEKLKRRYPEGFDAERSINREE